jgi:hypothetical protein
MKGNNSTLIDELKIKLTFAIMELANVYTGAKFTKPPTKDQAQVLAACSKIVLRDYVCLSLEELDEAFSLAVSGQFEGINIETYYGDFTPKILGTILKSYLVYRRKVLGAYNHQLQLSENKKKAIDLDERNNNTQKHVFEQYNDLKERFNESGDLELLEKEVCAYWGKILVQNNIITFTHDQKKEIVIEAKELTRKAIKTEMNESINPNERRSLRTVLQDIGAGEQNASFDLKWKNLYSKLIIIKSIINS